MGIDRNDLPHAYAKGMSWHGVVRSSLLAGVHDIRAARPTPSGRATTERAARALEEFLPIAPVLGQTRLAPYAAVVAPTHHQHDGYSQLRSRNALVDHLDADAAAVLAGLLDRGDAGYVQVRSVGGASRRPAAASASRPTTTRRR
jgi:hypothetical protein